MISSAHPHALHVLSAIRDAFVDLSPEELSLDVQASDMIVAELDKARQRLATDHLLNESQLGSLTRARSDLADAINRCSGAAEHLSHCLAAYQSTVDSVGRNAPLNVSDLLVGRTVPAVTDPTPDDDGNSTL